MFKSSYSNILTRSFLEARMPSVCSYATTPELLCEDMLDGRTFIFAPLQRKLTFGRLFIVFPRHS